MVEEQRLSGRPIERDAASVEDHCPPAHALDRCGRVRYEHHRKALLNLGDDVPKAFALKRLVADGQNLVHQQDVGAQVGGNREPKPDQHSGGVGLNRGIDEVAQLRERDDVVDPLFSLGPAHAVQRRAHVDVLPPRELAAETGPELDQRGHLAAARGVAALQRDDPGQHPQHRGLASAVSAHDPDRLSRRDPQRDARQRLSRRKLGHASPG